MHNILNTVSNLWDYFPGVRRKFFEYINEIQNCYGN